MPGKPGKAASRNQHISHAGGAFVEGELRGTRQHLSQGIKVKQPFARLLKHLRCQSLISPAFGNKRLF